MKKHIFILEDDFGIRDVIKLTFDAEPNYELSFFENVASFKARMVFNLPHLVVLDVMLPDGNGIQVCEWLKNDSTTQHIPILLMSARSDPANLRNSSCADSFIAKPFDITDFEQRVSVLISLANRYR